MHGTSQFILISFVLCSSYCANAAPFPNSETGNFTRRAVLNSPASWLPKQAGSFDWPFPHDDTWGDNVLVYVVDSGVRSTHVELAGRVKPGWVLPGFTGQTAVASLIAGKTLGIARMATIIPVRIADESRCSRGPTTTADATAGVEWAVADFKTQHAAKAGIINVSWQVFDTPDSSTVFKSAVSAGMHVVVTAGNNDVNQCYEGPATRADWRVRDVGQIVVGMTDFDDKRASMGDGDGSNFGDCVTLFAPGFSMTIASGKADTVRRLKILKVQTRTYRSGAQLINHGGEAHSGTSFAAPLVAGTIAALGKFLPSTAEHSSRVDTTASTQEKNLSPSDMKTLILQTAKRPAGLQNLGEGSPDILLQSPQLSSTVQ
ncbi:peptidase S8/S53 domain-containing protein [Mycena polygramma]|nr:peptidase S8/S53 domain-containing protein [Mycena polygramma]